MSEKKTDDKKKIVAPALIKPTLQDVFDDSSITGENNTRGKKKRRKRKIIPANQVCPLCEANIKEIMYKDIYHLKKYTSVRGKIISSAKSGVCSKHQRMLARAIKRARFMALLPYVAKD
jgi:small subunit ribosomal protein S18